MQPSSYIDSSRKAVQLADPMIMEKRLHPKPGDAWYLHLADLRRAMDLAANLPSSTVLDFGCGGSPYRPMFPNSVYLRADLEGVADLDIVIRPGEPLRQPDASVDLVLSSQVLEHVPNPLDYLKDCRRMLKPGGALAISTHGTFPDHDIPWDFHRWTSYGLRRELETAGFREIEIHRLTTGPRCVLQLWEIAMDKMPVGWSPFGIAWRTLRGLTRRFRPAFHRWADRSLAGHQLVAETEGAQHKMYLGLFAIAR